MLELLRKDIKLIINIKRQFITIIGFVLILVIFSAMFQDYMQEKRLIDKLHVGIVDNEGSRLSSMLIGHFQNNEEFLSLFTLEVDTEQALMDKFNDNQLSAIVHIPMGFTDSLLHFENTPLKILLNPNYPLQNTVLENIMTSYSKYIKAVDVGIYSLYQTLKSEGLEREILNDINETFSANMVLTALRRDRLFQHEVIETFPAATSGIYFIFAIILLMVIFVATSGSSLLSSEIKDQCLQRYKLTGNWFVKFTLSKLIVMYLNMMVLLLPMLVIVKFVTPSISLLSLVYLFAFLSLVIIFFTALSLTLGILWGKHDVNLLFSTMVTMVLGILGGNFIPIQIMPKFIQDISSMTPNYWMLRSCLYLSNNIYIQEFYMTTGLLILSTLVILFIQNILISRGNLWEK